MSNEIYIAYWSGEEPTGPGQSPTLDKTPDYVDIVPLFYVLINQDGSLDFNRLVLHNTQATIKGWMEEIRKRQQNQPKKTKFTLGILSSSFPSQDPAKFAETVKSAVNDWGVDGVTVDFEPPDGDANILDVVKAIRVAIGANAIMTAPVYDAWMPWPDLLKSYSAYFNYIETMDYTPYPGEQSTLSNYEWYAQAIGSEATPAYDRIAIGVSCMEPSKNNYTPLADVIDLCKYEPKEPKGAKKAGIMLYTLSYDVSSHGSGYPDGTFAETINKNLP